MARNRLERHLQEVFGINPSDIEPGIREVYAAADGGGAGREDGYVNGRRIVDDTVTYKPEVLQAVRELARAKPWQGSVAERQDKIRRVHKALCAIYDKQTTLEFCTTAGDSGRSYFNPAADRIALHGRLSVVTYLQMFAYAAFGRRPERVVIWSVNLFRRKFPLSWSRCHFEGHMVINDSRSEV